MSLPIDPFRFPVELENEEQYSMAIQMLEYTKHERFGYLFRPVLKARGLTDEQIEELIAISIVELTLAIAKYDRNQTPRKPLDDEPKRST